jgi:hypothetical protein
MLANTSAWLVRLNGAAFTPAEFMDKGDPWRSSPAAAAPAPRAGLVSDLRRLWGAKPSRRRH